TLLLSIGLAASAVAQSESNVATVDVIVPVVGTLRGYGGVEWHTDVVLRNDVPVPIEVVLTLVTAPGEPFFFTTLAPGETVALTDVASATFGMRGVLSPLLVQTLGPRSVTIGCRVYGVRDGKTTEPQTIVPIASTLRRSQSLSGLAFDARRRTNIGVANLGEQPVIFTFAVQRIAGRNLATAAFVMPPRSMMQAPIEMFFPLLKQAGQLSVLVDLPTPSTYVYASVVDNESHDALFVPPRAGRF
ncbi:MAG TPA: hypothetical protein VIL97_10020, partial [Thermoanaerobaculia bacterium]